MMHDPIDVSPWQRPTSPKTDRPDAALAGRVGLRGNSDDASPSGSRLDATTNLVAPGGAGKRHTFAAGRIVGGKLVELHTSPRVA